MANRHKRLDASFGGAVDVGLLRNFFHNFYPQYPGPRRWFELVAWYRTQYGVEQAQAVARELKNVLHLTSGQSQISDALRTYGCAYAPVGNVRDWLVKFERKLKQSASPNNSFKPNPLRSGNGVAG